jgi:hypothetical protein
MTAHNQEPEATPIETKLRVPCEVYSRVVGYLRPVQNWHQGKQQEFRERKPFRMSGVTLPEKKSQ